jgi:RecA-family ATPase
VLHSEYGEGRVTSASEFMSRVAFPSGEQIVANGNLQFMKAAPSAANDNSIVDFINPADWQGEPVPDRQWYVPDLIPMRQVTLLSGDGGVGKSLLAIQIAAAGAMSVETLGLVPWAGSVVYLGAEDEADEFHRRLSDISRALGGDLSDLHLFRLLPMADADAILSTPNRAGQMEPTPLWTRLVAEAKAIVPQPRLIVLDTAADLFGGDEIKRGQVRQFIGMLRKLAMEIDCAIVLLAHPSVQGMQTGTGLSGSTGWGNSVRSRLYLTADRDDPDLRVLTTKKANYGKVGGEIRLRWQDGAFVLDDGKPTAAAGLLNRRDDGLFRDLLSSINRSGQRVAPTKGVNYAPSIMAMRPEAKSTSKKALEAAMQRLLAAGLIKVIWDGPPSKQRQRLIVSAEDFGPDSGENREAE